MLIAIRKLKKQANCDSNAALRQKYGVLSGAVGIMLNLLLFGGKLFAGYVSASVAIIADAFNNLSDAGSSVVAMVGFKLSGKKPDPQHPFGHGRFEYITGFIVSVIIIIMGFELGLSSIRSIGKPESIAFSTVTVAVLSGSILVKLYMALYNTKFSKLFSSATFKATAVDSLSDCVATFGVLAALIISRYTSLQLDSYAGLLVSAFILYSGIMSAKDTLEPLLGAPPKPEFIKKVESIVLSHPGVVGMHDLVVHDYGPGRVMLSLHVELPSDVDVHDAHTLIDSIEGNLEVELNCEAVIHLDPTDTEDMELLRQKRIVSDVVKHVDSRITIHDFRSAKDGEYTNLIFDIVVPFDCKACDQEVLDYICKRVEEVLPMHRCSIKCDKASL